MQNSDIKSMVDGMKSHNLRTALAVNFCRNLPAELMENAVAVDISNTEGLEAIVPSIPGCKALLAVAHVKEA